MYYLRANFVLAGIIVYDKFIPCLHMASKSKTNDSIAKPINLLVWWTDHLRHPTTSQFYYHIHNCLTCDWIYSNVSFHYWKIMVSHYHSSTRAEGGSIMTILDTIIEVGELGGHHCHLILLIDHMQQLVVGPDGWPLWFFFSELKMQSQVFWCVWQ